MKQQASLEFLIIAGAISLLVLSAITQYGGMVKRYGSPSVPYIAYSPPASPTYYQRPYLEATMPVVSSGLQNRLTLAAYGCSNGTVSVSMNSSTISFSTYNITQNFFNVWVYSDAFFPSTGLNRAGVRYSISCNGLEYNGSQELSTTYLQAPAQPAYSAYLSKRNESINYSIHLQDAQSLSETSHCTYENFFYTPYSIGGQCGTADAWEYSVQSGICSSNGGSFTATICVLPQDSGYDLVTGSSINGYSYSANLTMAGGYLLSSRISSNAKVSGVYYSGKDVGTVHVENVTSAQPLHDAALVYAGNVIYVNSTYLNEYVQARQSLFSLLSYYNSSSVSSDVASQIQQGLYEYNHYQSQLMAVIGNSTPSKCRISAGYMECPSQYPLYYTINASISPSYWIQNQTIQYQGSIIKVSN